MRLRSITLLVLALAPALSCADLPVGPRNKVTVQGTVRDRDGSAVQGASIYFRPLDPLPETTPGTYPPSFPSARTESDGSFTVQLVEGRYRVTIYPNTQGLPGVEIPSFRVEREGTRLDYRYSGTLVSGSITGPGGATLPSAYVAAYSTSFGGGTYTQATGGSYRLLLNPGRYQFQASADFYESGLVEFYFEAEISTQDTTIDLDFSGHEIRVSVDFDGSPLSGVSVSAEGQGRRAASRTDIQGSTTLYLPTGGYTIRASTENLGITGPEERYEQISGPGSVSFSPSGVAWDVTLRRETDGSVIPQAHVEVREIVGSRVGYTRSDGGGKFRMVVQPDQAHLVRVILTYPTYTERVVSGIASSADSTFDLLIDAPPLP